MCVNCVHVKIQHILYFSLAFHKKTENKKLGFAARGLGVDITFIILHKCHKKTKVFSHCNINSAVLFCIRPADFEVLWPFYFGLYLHWGKNYTIFKILTHIKMKCYVLQLRDLCIQLRYIHFFLHN